MSAPIVISRNDMISYIQATLIGGMKKAVAYKAHIDPLVSQTYAAINRLEKRDDFIELMQAIVDTDELAAKKQIMRVKGRYMMMTEKALETAAGLLDDAESKEEKAQAVRLANETFGAMGIIAVTGVDQKRGPAAIDKSGAIL